MQLVERLHRQDTLLASDSIWTKPCLPQAGLPALISPSRNEPDDIDSLTPRSTRSFPQTLQLQLADSDVHDKVDIDVQTSVTGLQVGILHF